MKWLIAVLLLCLPACSGTRRRTAPQPPAPEPEVRTEVSVIPPQEVKGHGPFYQWQASFGESKPATQVEGLPSSSGGMNSDGF